MFSLIIESFNVSTSIQAFNYVELRIELNVFPDYDVFVIFTSDAASGLGKRANKNESSARTFEIEELKTHLHISNSIYGPGSSGRGI